MTLEDSGAGFWRPRASLEALEQRARLLDRIRHFFRQRDVLEVETPILSQAGIPSPALESFTTRYRGPALPGPTDLYLHTSPEFPMKRLLAAGCGSIFQICKVFRNGEAGRLHNPEFTMLEWYRTGFDEFRLMDEVESLLHEVLPDGVDLPRIERISYRRLFQTCAGVDGLTATVTDLQTCLGIRGIEFSTAVEGQGLDGWRDLVLTRVILPVLNDRVLFVYDYPETQAALARLREGTPPVARRFELFWRGIELANGFRELTDAAEQSRRFAVEQQQRRMQELPDVALDARLVAALQAGLPDCSGVAIGVDRLLMIVTGRNDIRDVLAFPVDRA